MIPVLIAIVLIVILGGSIVGIKIIDRYSYSKEKANLEEYFKVSNQDMGAVLLQDDMLEVKSKKVEGLFYLDMNSVKQYLNDRFYVDSRENLLLYTTPTDIISTTIGEKTYTSSQGNVEEEYVLSLWEGDTLYVALDYVKKYTNFIYEVYENPNRVQLYLNEYPERTLADATKDTAIRYQGGIKSDILKEVKTGEPLSVLETLENWSKVKSEDGFIGYVEHKHLGNERIVIKEELKEYEEPVYTNISKEYTINLGWHQVTSQEANSTLEATVANTKSLNTISPTWFALSDNEGGFVDIASREYVDKAHQMGLEVWGLVDNFTYEVNTNTILSATSNRRKLIDGLVGAALEYNLDGINIDFEQISEETGEHYVQFIRELSILCRANNIVLSVDNYVPKEYSTHYNRKEQGIVADYVIIMGYDEHWGGGGVAGSVASINFVEEGILKTLEEVPAEKVINAVPFYTRIWNTKGGEVKSDAAGMSAVEKFLTKNSMTVQWDEETCQNYAEIQLEDIFYQVWLEDAQSMEVKLNIMKMHNLAGVAAWKLGLEKPEIWDVISTYVNS